MRIVYLNPSGQLGGAETSLLAILGSMRAAVPNWELFLLVGEDGPLSEQARKLGVMVSVVPFPPSLARLGDSTTSRWHTIGRLAASFSAALRYKHSLARILRSLRPDLLHTNGFKMHLMGAWARPQGIPLLWHIHDYVSPRPLMKHLLQLFRKRCTAIVANSHSVATDIAPVFTGMRVVPVYNAIDLQRFSPAGFRLDLDAAANLPPAPDGTVRVGLVSTFARWKGHQTFLQAMARLSPALPVRGYIIGGPIYRTIGSQWSIDELTQVVRRLGLENRVGFTGFLADTAAAMRSLDIAVHASTHPEPFGMVIIEGMACGTAVIASDAGGARELFADGETALGHAPGDDAQLAAQIERLVNNAGLRKQLARNGRRTAETLFDAKRLAEQLVPLYRESATSGEERDLDSVQFRPGADVKHSDRAKAFELPNS